MMKKKLVAALIVFSGMIAFSPSDAHARPHHKNGIHHANHRHHTSAHARRSARKHHGYRVRSHGARASRGRPSAWCGWWLGQHLGIGNRNLWLARNWASVGRRTQPGIGVVVVWRHHVGIITGRAGSQWIVKSGNDGHAVRERPRSTAGAIAFRAV
jgi:hypothetical protein